jgi:hypothetical protein
LLQPPQCRASLLMSTQAAAQLRAGARHESVQRPAEHTLPVGQRVPQAPQFAGSLSTSTQSPPQSLYGLRQVERQRAASQLVRLPGLVSQALPQPPQFAASDSTFTQLEPQASEPFWHAKLQLPSRQTAAAPFGAVQAA